MPTIRLNKFLAQKGVASRRFADTLIAEGRVSVNGSVVRDMGVQVDPTVDAVVFNGEKLTDSALSSLLYYAVYKPRGYVSTTTSRFGEHIVTSLVPIHERLFPVGRLDKDSEGLMILTNDGDFAYKITHPKYSIDKTYKVLVKGSVTSSVVEQLASGISLEDGLTAPCRVVLDSHLPGGDSWLLITLHEGRKRQIRRMCAAVHLFVKQLIRIEIGKIKLGDLKSGEYKVIPESTVRLVLSEI